MKTTLNGKIRRSESEWRAIFENFERSGLSQTDFCELEGIAVTSFQKWRRKLTTEREASFVELKTEGREKASAVEFSFPSGLIVRIGA